MVFFNSSFFNVYSRIDKADAKPICQCQTNHKKYLVDFRIAVILIPNTQI